MINILETFRKMVKASLLDLNVTGKMTLDQLNKTYGKDLQKVNNQKHNTTGIYFYQPNSKGMTVWFDVDNVKLIAW